MPENNSLLLARQLDRVCDSFERAWNSGERPSLDQFLSDSELGKSDELLEELLAIEIHHRLCRGEQPQTEEYASRLRDVDRAWLEGLIAQEIGVYAPRSEQSTKPISRAESARSLPNPSSLNARLGGLSPPGYEIIREIGRGGMGVVYQARQMELGRLVAIKMISAGDLAVADEIARFRREAATIAQLNDPHIVQLFEIGIVQGKPYLVMEYVHGSSLSEMVRQALPPPRVAAQLVSVLARTMQEVHRRNIVHRDLKPANILMAEDPFGATSDRPQWEGALRPKITDFGLAKTTTESCGLTMSGGILGTPSYMSPEQARGDSQVAAPTDVYGLGAILYELLTGRPPFKSFSVASTIQQVLEEEPVAPRRIQPQIPADLNTICLKCLEKSPESRYAEARLLADDLDRFLRHEPIQARAASMPVRMVRWCQRYPARAAAAALALVAALSLACVGVVYPFALSQAEAARAMRAEQKKTAAALEQVSALRGEAERLSASLAINQGQVLCEGDSAARGMLWMARGLELLSDHDSPLALATRKNITAWRKQVHVLKQVRPLPRESMAMAMNRTGDRVAIAGFDRQVHVFETEHGEPVGTALELPQVASTVAFSHDGTLLACGDLDGTISLWSVSGHSLLRSWKAHGEQIYDLAFTDSDQRLVSAGRDSLVHFWNPSDGARLGQSLVHSGAVICLAISPDGRQLLTGSIDGFLRRFSLRTGEADGTPVQYSSGVVALAYSHDGRAYALGRIDGVAQIYDAASDRPQGQPVGHRAHITSIDFSLDDRRLLTSSRDATARLWDVSTSRPIGAPLEHRDEVCAARFTPDGKSIVTTAEDRTLRLWAIARSTDLDPRLQPSTVTEPPLTRSAPAWISRQFLGMRWRHLHTQLVGFSPSGKLAYGITGGALELGKARAIQLYDSRSGERVGDPLAHDAVLADIAFSPNESQIATVTKSGAAQIWDVGASRTSAARVLAAEGVSSASFFPNRQIVVTAGRSGVEFWNCSDGSRALPAVTNRDLKCVVFDNFGKRLALVQGAGDVDVYDARTMEIAGTCLNQTDAGVSSAAFSNDGRSLLVSNWDGVVRVWRTNALDTNAVSLVHQEPVWAAQFSPDGRIVAAATMAGNLYLWNADTGAAITTPFQLGESIDDLAFSPDSRTVLLGSYEKKSRLIDVLTGRPIGPVQWTKSPVQHVHFAGGGEHYVSGDQTPLLRVYESPAPHAGTVAAIKAELESMSGLRLDANGTTRCLSAEEWHSGRTKR